MSIGDDYWIGDCWIEDDRGRRVCRVDDRGRRRTLVFEDPAGRELARLRERVLWTRSMAIEGADGHRIATVQRGLVDVLGALWVVRMEGGPALALRGDVPGHEYRLHDGRTTVATVSTRWFGVDGSYGVAVAPHQDPVLVVAATVAVDSLADDGLARGAATRGRGGPRRRDW